MKTKKHIDLFFKLKEAKDCFKNSEYYDSKANLRTALEKILQTTCVEQAHA